MTPTTQNLLLTLAGLASTTITAGLGLYFAARSRTAPLRQHLYQEQFALVVRIVRIVGKIRTFAPMVVERDGPFYDRALDDLRTKVRQLAEATDTSAAILPTELYVEVQQLKTVVVDFLGAHDEGRDTSWFPAKLAGHAAKTALLARTFIGVDELSGESASLFTKQKDLARVARLKPDAIAAAAKNSLDKRQDE